MASLDTFFTTTKTKGAESASKMHIQMISYKNIIETKFQYRDISRDSVVDLADLIECDGRVLQNLVVRKLGGDTYEIIAGHRRCAAIKLLVEERDLPQFSLVPCEVISTDDIRAEFMAYSTNGYGKGKSEYQIMTEINGMIQLITEHPDIFQGKGRVADRLANLLGISGTSVREYRAMDNNLTDNAKEAFKNGEIGKSAAYELSKMSGEKQDKLVADGVKTVKDLRAVDEPTQEEILFAFEEIKDAFHMNSGICKTQLIERYGRTLYYIGYHDNQISCSRRGIAINDHKEITWTEFVKKVNDYVSWNDREHAHSVNIKRNADQTQGQMVMSYQNEDKEQTINASMADAPAEADTMTGQADEASTETTDESETEVSVSESDTTERDSDKIKLNNTEFELIQSRKRSYIVISKDRTIGKYLDLWQYDHGRFVGGRLKAIVTDIDNDSAMDGYKIVSIAIAQEF